MSHKMLIKNLLVSTFWPLRGLPLQKIHSFC